ncbi:MAG: hypothetical protein QXQ53_04425 [Candidatus Methanosuratincola sp.]
MKWVMIICGQRVVAISEHVAGGRFVRDFQLYGVSYTFNSNILLTADEGLVRGIEAHFGPLDLSKVTSYFISWGRVHVPSQPIGLDLGITLEAKEDFEFRMVHNPKYCAVGEVERDRDVFESLSLAGAQVVVMDNGWFLCLDHIYTIALDNDNRPRGEMAEREPRLWKAWGDDGVVCLDPSVVSGKKMIMVSGASWDSPLEVPASSMARLRLALSYAGFERRAGIYVNPKIAALELHHGRVVERLELASTLGHLFQGFQLRLVSDGDESYMVGGALLVPDVYKTLVFDPHPPASVSDLEFLVANYIYAVDPLADVVVLEMKGGGGT